MRRSVLIAVGIVTIVVAFATIRVRPYLAESRSDGGSEQRDQVVRIVKGAVVPSYDMDGLRASESETAGLVYREVHQALSRLPVSERPSRADSEAIAKVYSDYYMLNRLGSLRDALEKYGERNVEPPQVLAQDDSAKANIAWLRSTAWSRHAPFKAESVRVRRTFSRGKAVVPPRANGAGIEARQLSSGGFLSLDEHQFDCYEIIVHADVPALDGSAAFGVDICVSIINDRPGSAWDIAEVTWDNRPAGKVFRLPSP